MKITPIEWHLRFEELGCQLLNTNNKLKRLGNNPKFNIRGQCGHNMRVNYHNIKKSPDIRCNNCKKSDQKYFSKQKTYHMIVSKFLSRGCIVQTTLSEFINQEMTSQSKIKYIAKCGHLRISNFYHQQSSNVWTCKSCTN